MYLVSQIWNKAHLRVDSYYIHIYIFLWYIYLPHINQNHFIQRDAWAVRIIEIRWLYALVRHMFLTIPRENKIAGVKEWFFKENICFWLLEDHCSHVKNCKLTCYACKSEHNIMFKIVFTTISRSLSMSLWLWSKWRGCALVRGFAWNNIMC